MENKTNQKEQPQNRSCDTCKNAPICHKVVGYIKNRGGVHAKE